MPGQPGASWDYLGHTSLYRWSVQLTFLLFREWISESKHLNICCLFLSCLHSSTAGFRITSYFGLTHLNSHYSSFYGSERAKTIWGINSAGDPAASSVGSNTCMSFWVYPGLLFLLLAGRLEEVWLCISMQHQVLLWSHGGVPGNHCGQSDPKAADGSSSWCHGLIWASFCLWVGGLVEVWGVETQLGVAFL